MVKSMEFGVEEQIAAALVKEGILSEDQLLQARRISDMEGSLLLETLVALGLVVRGVMVTMMGLHLKAPVEDLRNV